MNSHSKRGKEKIEEARKKLAYHEYNSAAHLLREAINDFDSAINNATNNCGTNFVAEYNANKLAANELLKKAMSAHFSGEKISVEEEAKEVVEPKETQTEETIQEEKKVELTPSNDFVNNVFDEEEKKEALPAYSHEGIQFVNLSHDINVILGQDEESELVTWKPKTQANQHLVSVGMSGTGKTTVVRTILHQLELQNVPLIIFDLHDDFEAKKKINFSDITINPLELDGLTPKEKAIEFAYICKRIFGLGDQQENKLREAIVHCYRARGIEQLDKNTWSIQPPTLNDINEFLEANRDGKTIDTLLGRVKFFHRVELFMSETRCPFQDMFNGSTVIKLIEFSDNPDLQTALCEIFLNKLLFTVKKAGQSKLRAYCVIDEAHILDDGKDSYRSPLVKIAREARKYGLGLIMASQMPKDFSKSVLHNTATIISLKFNAREEAKAISDQMFGITENDILTLGEVGQGFVKLGSDVKKVRFFQKEDLS